MDNTLFARSQMGLSLGFHIVFAAVGMTMPLFMVISEALWLRTKKPVYLSLTKAWVKGTAVFFAIGAVSGTVLAFELGLLFPRFMEHAGPVIGMPFSLEGFAFFTEAIFLGIYVYGWNRVPPLWHWLSGVVVTISGAASALFVTLANSWMNAPLGFSFEKTATGLRFFNIDPVAAMLSPYALHEVPHSLLAAYMATAFAVAAIHARQLLKGQSEFHREALKVALIVAIPCALLQPPIGHFAGQRVAELQPLKFAAMESQFKTERGASLLVGGIPDFESQTVHFGLRVPNGLSFLATGHFDGLVRGLEEYPKEDWPSHWVHFAFQIMVGLGTALALLSLWAIYLRKKAFTTRNFLKLVVWSGPLGYLALEAGWIVTEMGRQPWIIQGVQKTKESVTPMPGLIVPFLLFSLIYLLLGSVTFVVLRRHVRLSPVEGTSHV